ncbi:MAG: helix-turn-helix domain-containing protein [Bacilli bacterium]|nr:helix-turn-helix domain-containing protein [Bacilli bacterium]
MSKRKSNKDLGYRYRLGQNIARIRKQETGYTQEDMELYTGVSRAYYGRIELGVHAASIDVLIKIADALNVPLYRLFLDENDKPI